MSEGIRQVSSKTPAITGAAVPDLCHVFYPPDTAALSHAHADSPIPEIWRTHA